MHVICSGGLASITCACISSGKVIACSILNMLSETLCNFSETIL